MNITQDVSISNMISKDEIIIIVAVERHLTHTCIANQHKDRNFGNSSACMHEDLFVSHPKAGYNRS